MNREDWLKIEELLNAALELEPSRRREFLDAIEADSLRRDVESLLVCDARTDGFLATSAMAFANDFFADDAPDALLNQKVGNYRIIRELGRGGMGAVYLAERDDGKFEQKVAVKLLKRELNTANVRRRFDYEREILAALSHPNIARLLDAGTTADGVPFLVMEYVEGLPLDEFCERENADLERRLQIFRRVCEAVAFAHRNLVVHRDLKPSNIIVTGEGVPKLLDFGISKILSGKLEDAATVTKAGVMTVAYASPEQLRNESVTTATDVYSLGVILYELLSGLRPFEQRESNFWELYNSVLAADPPPPSAMIETSGKTFSRRQKSESGEEISRKSELPTVVASERGQTAPSRPRQTAPQFARIKPQFLRGDLDNIVLKALKKEPERRYLSAENFSEDIGRHLAGLPVRARPDTFSYRATKFINRNRLAVVAGLLIVLSLLGGTIATLWQLRRAEANQARAEKRFADVRQLANSLLFDIAPRIERLEGSIEAREAVVTQSLKYLDSLAGESFDDARLQAELAAAYERVADLQGNPGKPNLGDFAGAAASYEKANQIRRRLPETWENQASLAQNHRALAAVHYSQNDFDRMFLDYAQSLEIYENLSAKNPHSLELETARLKTKFEFAEGYSYNYQYAKAVPIYREVIGALERFDPNRRETRQFLANAYAMLGNDLSWDNRQPEAEAEMAKATAIAERLAAEFPNDTAARHTAYKVYMTASVIYENINNEISLQWARKALQTIETAVERDAADAQAKQNLAKSFSRIGIVFALLKKFPEAAANLEKSEKIYLGLIERDPKNRSYQSYLGIIYTRFGDLKHRQGDLRGSLKDFQKSAEWHEKAFQPNDKNMQDRRNLAQSLKSAGDVQLELGEKAQAAENYRRAWEILNALKAQNALGEWDSKMFDEVRAALRGGEEND